MVNAIGGFNTNMMGLNDVAKQAISLATELHGTAGMLKNVGSMFENLGKIVGGTQGNANVAQQAPLSTQLQGLLQQLTNLLGGLSQMLGGLQGGAQGAGGAQAAGGGAQAGGAGAAGGAPDMGKLFGLDNPFEDGGEAGKKAKAQAAATGDGPKSLGALLALVGSILTKSMEGVMKQLQDAAKTLDNASQGGGPTASLNQKIQELTFNLQQIQQTLNRVNETVTNLSRSQSDAMKSVTQNLSV